MTDQTRMLCASLPNFATILKAADARNASNWEIVRWEEIDPDKVTSQDIQVVGLSDLGEEIKINEFPNRTRALIVSADWVRQHTQGYTEKEHKGVWRWQQDGKTLFQTVLPVNRNLPNGKEPGSILPVEPENRSTMVRVSDAAYKILRRMANEEGKNMQTVLEEALKTYEASKFFDDLDLYYKELRHDPVAWKEELEERALWDNTLMDGIDRDESRHEDGTVTVLQEMERQSA